MKIAIFRLPDDHDPVEQDDSILSRHYTDVDPATVIIQHIAGASLTAIKLDKSPQGVIVEVSHNDKLVFVDTVKINEKSIDT